MSFFFFRVLVGLWIFYLGVVRMSLILGKIGYLFFLEEVEFLRVLLFFIRGYLG